MTCPVDPHARSAVAQAANGPQCAVRMFEDITGSVFLGLFGAGLFDQAMLPAVSAALEATGRIRNQPVGRALRTAASDQLVFLGADADRIAESERLMRLHRDVRGIGTDGARYSALSPEAWNFILISTFFVHRGVLHALLGRQLTPAENQDVWDYFRHKTDGLQLSGNSRLVSDYDTLAAYYVTLARTTLVPTTTLDTATLAILRPVRPEFLPAVVQPLWALAAPTLGHLLAVLGFGIMHTDVRAKVPMTWTRRHDLEFALLTTGLRIAYRRLPRYVTDTPMARNRRKYHRLVSRYRGIGLASFAPPGTHPR